MNRLWVFCLLLLPLAAVEARTLHWESLQVQARLDADGALHVAERHAMVFDGDWNGGERVFQVRPWQSLTLHSVTRVSPDTAARTAVVEGNLRDIDTWQLANGRQLRWRSRMPDDPPFQNSLQVYDIIYTLRGVLQREGDAYLLNHDLAFADRSGEIVRFDATLVLDPVWQAPGLPTQFHREHLAPGQSEIVSARLSFSGVEAPTAIAPEGAGTVMGGTVVDPARPPAPSGFRYGALLVVLGFAVVAVALVMRRERNAGRFAPLAPTPDQIDEAWLRDNLFHMRPEVVGAAWDRQTDASEVAALLARLALEGKIESEVRQQSAWVLEREVLHLTLKCDRDSLEPYERALIDKLFFDGRTQTDTDSIRSHYKTKGLYPSQIIDAGVKKLLPVPLRSKDPFPYGRMAVTAACLVVGAVLVAIGWSRTPRVMGIGFALGFVTLGIFVVGAVLSWAYRNHVSELRRRIVGALVCPLLVLVVGSIVLLVPAFTLSITAVIGVALIVIGLLNSLIGRLASRESSDSLAVRRTLCAAREYFKRELAAGQPRLKDEWLPYLIALELGSNVQRWFKDFGAESASIARRAGRASDGSFGGGSVSAPSSWTGGGGTFGGAGASGSWVSAVSGLAAGTSAASSSSSSSGGSSSGGGGGGGW